MESELPSRQETAAMDMARRLFGEEAWIARRIVATRAGPFTGRLHVGYQVCLPGTDGGGRVLGSSPPPGASFNLAALGTLEEALEDARRRRSLHLGPYAGEPCGERIPVEGAIPPQPRVGARRRSPFEDPAPGALRPATN